MTHLEKGAATPLIASLATCGGVYGPQFRLALSLAESEGGNLEVILPRDVLKAYAETISSLSGSSDSSLITPGSVLSRFGSPKHFHDMNSEAQRGMDSVAREIDPSIRAVAHTLLPVHNSVYMNEGRVIRFKGLVPLGPRGRNMVVHLGGIFASCCSDSEIRELLAAQAEDMEFLKMADSIGTLDYEGTQLQKATQMAKKQLGI